MKFTDYYIVFCSWEIEYEQGNTWNSPLLGSVADARKWAQDNSSDDDSVFIERQILCSAEEAKLLKDAENFVLCDCKVESLEEVRQSFKYWSLEQCQERVSRMFQNKVAHAAVVKVLGKNWYSQRKIDVN